jgi:hypothetical protein
MPQPEPIDTHRCPECGHPYYSSTTARMCAALDRDRRARLGPDAPAVVQPEIPHPEGERR